MASAPQRTISQSAVIVGNPRCGAARYTLPLEAGQIAPGLRPGSLELQGAGMPDTDRARVRWLKRSDLPESRFHLVDEKVDDVAGTKRAERTEPPQKGLARKNHIGTKRHGAHHIEAGANAAVQHHHGSCA